MKAKEAQTHLRSLSNSDTAEKAQRYFKTGTGDYGAGDQFLGIRVPVLRAETKRYAEMQLDEVGKLLKSSYHEERLFALLLLVHQFNKSVDRKRDSIYEYYMNNTEYINNWDLVDSSAYYIAGAYLFDKSRKPLYDLAKSPSLWERRVSIISTLHFIRKSDYSDTLGISKILLQDKEDLIQKAVGWMLREVGNRDRNLEEEFLNDNYRDMPRTMLRYAIEKLPETKRQSYLKGLA